MGKVIDTLQPGQEKPYPVGGNYLTVVRSLQLLEIELINRADTVESHIVKSGTLHDKSFDSIVVQNLGDVAVDITIVTGIGKITPSQDEAVVTVDTSTGSVPVTVDEGQLNLSLSQLAFGNDNQHLPRVSIPAGLSAKIADSNIGVRRFLRIALLSDAVGYVTLGKSGVGATSGGPLEPGMIDYQETEGEMWAHNPNAEAVFVWVQEINKIA